MTRLAPALLLTAVLVAGCAGDEPSSAGRGTDTGGEPAPAGSTAPAPDGFRLAGLSGVTVQVPDDWGSTVYDGCSQPPDSTVVYRTPGRTACGKPITRERSWVAFEPLRRGDSILLAMGRARPLGEEKVRQTGLSCLGKRPLLCDQTVAVPGLGVLVHVHLVGDDAEGTAAEIRRSLALVPEGYVVVPPIRFGTSDDDALAMLAEAGLEGDIPQVDWPHYVTESQPPAGTVVEEGSTVVLRIGDG